MIDLPGLFTISLVLLMTLFLMLRSPDITRIIFSAFIIRILFLLINNYIFPLPDSQMDAKNFEEFAWIWSRGGFLNIFNYYMGPDPYFISVLLAIPYFLFDRSLLMLQSLSILIGILSVYFGWLLTKNFWDSKAAAKVGWILALFPTLVSYSVLVMREVYIFFFLILAIYGIVGWFREGKNIKSAFLIIFGFIAATFFHGASILGLFVFLLVICLISINLILKQIKVGKLGLENLVFVMIPIIVLGFFFTNNMKIPYFKSMNHITNKTVITDTINLKVKGDAAYPDWTKINNMSELFYKIPIRAAYFLFSPFPWDIKKMSHLIGLLDGLFHVMLVFLIFLNFRVILKDPALRTILLILIAYFIVFGVGVGNFGTGIRHRSKFIFLSLILVAPLIPKLVFHKKIK